MKRRRTGWAFALIAAALLISAGCDAVGGAAGAEPAPEQELRIISHLPSFTEILFELGLGDRLVGITDYCNYPPETARVARIGGYYNPDFEKAIALHPTLAILPDPLVELRTKYRALGMKTLVLRKETIGELYQAIEEIGRATGRVAEAEKLAARLRGEFDEVRQAVAGLPPVRTMVIIGHEPGSLREIFVAGAKSFHHEALEIAGGRNIFDDLDTSYAKVSKEEILSRDPEAIILLSDKIGLGLEEDGEELRLWSDLPYLSAVKNGKIRIIRGDYAFLPGPRLPRLAREFASLLHPGVL